MIEIMWRASRLRGCFRTSADLGGWVMLAGLNTGRRAVKVVYYYQHIDNNNMIDILAA